MRLHLVRHGETQANREGVIQGDLVDEPLNAAGRAQAEALARRFARDAATGLHVAAVYASPLRRARETADQIARALGRPRVETLPGLREVSWGAHMGRRNEGAVRESMRAVLDAWDRGDHDARAPGGESPREAWARAAPDLAMLLARHAGDDVVVVGHGRINKIALSMLVHGSLDHTEEFPQPNSGVTLVERERVDGATRWYAPLRGHVAHQDERSALPERH